MSEGKWKENHETATGNLKEEREECASTGKKKVSLITLPRSYPPTLFLDNKELPASFHSSLKTSLAEPIQFWTHKALARMQLSLCMILQYVDEWISLKESKHTVIQSCMLMTEAFFFTDASRSIFLPASHVCKFI